MNVPTKIFAWVAIYAILIFVALLANMVIGGDAMIITLLVLLGIVTACWVHDGSKNI